MSQCKLKLALLAAISTLSLLTSVVSAQVAKEFFPPVSVVSGALPRVTQIDNDALKKLLKPNGKPLMINFWATWCDGCREEFPDLVKLDRAYRGKIDLLTVTLDDLADKDTLVTKFLGEMKAEMPTYLLVTSDEDATMKLVSPDWSGGLPMTIIYAPNGDRAYLQNSKIRVDAVSTELDKLLLPKPAK